MPVSVPFQTYQPPTIDLASIQQRKAQIENAQKQEMWNNIMQAIVGGIQKVMQAKQGQATLEKLGLTKKTPIMKEGELGSPEWNKFAQGLMAKGIVATPESRTPTGKFKREFDVTGLKNLPAGIKLDLSSMMGGMPMSYEAQQPSMFQNLTINQEGEPSIKIGDMLVPIKSLTKTGFSVQGQESYTDTKRADIQAASERIRSGTSTYEAEKKNLLAKYPDISYDTFLNLRETGKLYKPEIEQKIKAEKVSGGSLRLKAVQELRKAGYPVTENNIKSAMEQLK